MNNAYMNLSTQEVDDLLRFELKKRNAWREPSLSWKLRKLMKRLKES